MLTPYTETQKKRIANNIIEACYDINKLSKQAYNYLNLCSGFLIFSDIGGNITLEARLPCQQIKQQQKVTQEQQFLNALYNCGESKQ